MVQKETKYFIFYINNSIYKYLCSTTSSILNSRLLNYYNDFRLNNKVFAHSYGKNKKKTTIEIMDQK